MPIPDSFAAYLLRTSTPGLTRLAVQSLLPRLAAEGPALGAPLARAWSEHLAGRLADLAQALAEGRPEVFVQQVAWTRVAFAARDVNISDLTESLKSLCVVLTDELPPAAASSAVGPLEQALFSLEDMSTSTPELLSIDAPHGRLAATYFASVLEGHRGHGSDAVMASVSTGELTVRDALLHVCLPTQQEAGRMWHLNEITISEEHFISASTRRLISQLMTCAPTVEATGRSVMATSLGLDEHDIGLALVSELFALDGWRVLFLGSRLPVEELGWAAETYEPDLLLLSAATDVHRETVSIAIAGLRAAGSDLKVLVGGPAFDRHVDSWRDTGADAGAVPASEAVAVGRRLVGLDADA
jgi:methanogenic corrinoid protein MtbC1